MISDLSRARVLTKPANWPVFRLRHLSRLTGGGTPSKENPEFWSGGDIPWVSPKDMKRRRIDATEDYITAAAVDGSTTSFIESGSVLLVVRSGILKHSLPVAIADRRLTVNQDIKAFQFDSRVEPEFFAYWIEGQGSALLTEWRQLGATVESIDTRWMMDGLIALPPSSEQRTIVDFLDRETGRIDALIAKKERLVEVLQEKRTSAIRNEALGQSLGVSLRPSSVEWLPPIPSHWEIKKVSQIFRSLDSRRIPLNSEERADREKRYPYYGASGIIDYVDEFLFEEELLLVGEDGANLVLQSTPIAFIATGKYWVNNHAHVLKPRWGSLLFWTHVMNQVPYENFVTGSAQPKLTAQALANIPIPAPPEDEQHLVARRIDSAISPIEQLISRVGISVERLRELRSSLITAAVTGQIDPATWRRGGNTERTLEAVESSAEHAGVAS